MKQGVYKHIHISKLMKLHISELDDTVFKT